MQEVNKRIMIAYETYYLSFSRLKNKIVDRKAKPTSYKTVIQTIMVRPGEKTGPDCALQKFIPLVDICAAKISLDMSMSTSSSISVSVSSYRTR